MLLIRRHGREREGCVARVWLPGQFSETCLDMSSAKWLTECSIELVCLTELISVSGCNCFPPPKRHADTSIYLHELLTGPPISW